MPILRFITHPEVVIDPAIPVPDWRLSLRGVARMRAMLGQDWVSGIDAVWCSTERKAMEGADILADHLGLQARRHAGLGENDRSSTGYLPGPEFEAMADRFFAHPAENVSGWERALDAQARIVAAIDEVVTSSPAARDIAVVAHGAVGALYLCHLTGAAISRAADQPAGGGQVFTVAEGRLVHGWRAIDPA